jgi:type I restriction enzyme S subunit
MDYVGKYLFDEEILCVAEDGGSWGLNETCASYISEKCWVNNHAHVLGFNGKVDLKYLMYYLNNEDLNKYITGSTRGKLTKSAVDSIEIPLPPLPIQKRIAEILDAADTLKRKDQELLKKYDELAQAVFIDMFGDPVKNEKGWEVKTIGDSIDFMTSGSRGWAHFYTNTGDIFLRINNVGYNELKLHDLIYVTAPKNAESIRTVVRSGDILLSITADLGRTCVIPDDFPKAFINQHLAIIRLKKGFEPTFVSQVLSSEYGKLQFMKLNKGGVKAGLNFDDIKSLVFINPPIEIQIRYKKIVAEVTKQIIGINLISNKSDNLFNSLIQKAFNGELVN